MKRKSIFMLAVFFMGSALFAQPFKPADKNVVKNLEETLSAPSQKEILAAAKNNDLPKLQKILKAPLARTIVNAVDKELRTPLMYATKNKNLRMVELLLQNGALADQKDAKDNTVLHYAFSARDIAIFVEVLKVSNVKEAENVGLLHEMVLGQKQDTNLRYIRAYFDEAFVRGAKKYPKDPSALVRYLLYTHFPNTSDYRETDTLLDEVGTVNPKTKSYLEGLEKSYGYHL